MTGSPATLELIQKHAEMINNKKTASPKNQQLLNQICKQLAISLCSPLQEFIDGLLENFMYPEDERAEQDLFSLGHPRILELIYLRQKIEQLQSIDPSQFSSPASFFPGLLQKIEQVHTFLVHLLQVLSDHIEVPTQSGFYRRIVMSSISDFQRAFEQFKALDYVLLTLLRNLEKSGHSDKIFQVDGSLLLEIEQFTAQNVQWYEDLFLNSEAYKEFSSKGQTDVELFQQERKMRLQISTRRVF